ncbi:GFA family protein [Lysobacter humi (ex Lee et al. 2017)]
MKSGSCHCGAVRITVEGEPGGVIDCNCSHCSRKGFLLWFVPRASLEVSGEEYLATYTFNRHVIEHRFCRICGCQPFGLGRMPDGTETAAINIRCLDDVDLESIPRTAYDGRAG